MNDNNNNAIKRVRLGRTGLMVTKTAMGCLPIQRCSENYAIELLRAAYDAGINYFDTANAYTDSEHKLGLAFSRTDIKHENIIISTKSTARDKTGVLAHIENSLRELRTDYIDLFQFHAVHEVPDINEPDGMFAAALEAKARGWVRHIGVTTHRFPVAEACIATGNFDTLQFPFSYLSDEREISLAEKCRAADMGFIAMKGLVGGLLTNVRACHAFMKEHENVVPIWGIQKFEELDQWIDAAREDPGMTPEIAAEIEQDRKALAGAFCRGCSYCMPCPQGIEIFNCARMNMLLRRSPWRQYFTPEWRAKMEQVKTCLECGQCSRRCPYQLDTPNLLKFMLKDYEEFYEEYKDEL